MDVTAHSPSSLKPFVLSNVHVFSRVKFPPKKIVKNKKKKSASTKAIHETSSVTIALQEWPKRGLSPKIKKMNREKERKDAILYDLV